MSTMIYNKIEHPQLQIFKSVQRDFKHHRNIAHCNNYEEYLEVFGTKAFNTRNNIDQSSMLMVFLYEKKESVHYFIDSLDLYFMLENTPIKDIDAVRQSIDKSDLWGWLLRTREGGYLRHFAGYIHATLPSPATWFLFLKSNDEQFTLSTMIGHNNPTIGNDVVCMGGDFSIEEIYRGDLSNDEIRQTQLVVNLMLYMSAYPECVSEGVPETTDMGYQGHRVVRVASSGIVKPHGEMMAHYRNGHFRLLRDERFTRKRGQIIYVKPSFVKGKAVTVSEQEPYHD